MSSISTPRSEPAGKFVDQRDCSEKAASCSAIRMNRQSERPSRQRPFDQPVLDKRSPPSGASERRWRFIIRYFVAVAAESRGKGRRKKEELGKRQNLWRRFAYS